MANARQFMAERTGAWSSKQLPYDAEVEYLESTGTQCIETGVLPVLGMKFDFTLERLGTGNQIYFGCRGAGTSAENYQCFANWNGGSSAYLLFLWTGRAVGGSGSYSTYDLPLNVMTSCIGAEVVPPFAGTNGYTIQLFGFNVYGTRNTSLGVCRIKSLRAYDDEKEHVNLKAVRVGRVGYMYDSVSNQLFENIGTGAFVIGPDKTT